MLSEGRFVQPVKLTEAVKPFVAFTVNTVVADEPGALTFTVAGAKVMLKSGAPVTTSAV